MPAEVPPSDVDRVSAREHVAALPTGWLQPTDTGRLLAWYQLPQCPQRVTHSAAEAASTAAELGFPVALKITDAVHKTELHAVRLDLRSPAEVRQAFL